jgi:hypothetical protein
MAHPPGTGGWGERVHRSATGFCLLVAVLACCRLAAAAEPVGVITILEGDAVVIRGLSRLVPAEGVRVMSDDLFETGKSAFLRVEFADGTMMDLGPATRAQLNRPSLRRLDRPAVYLLSGWLKVSAGKVGGGAKASVGSPQIDAVGLAGETVERVEGGASAVFAEDGAVRVIDRRGREPVPISLKSGDFVVLHGSEAPRIESHPPHDFVAELPRSFQDPLPSRIAMFRDHSVAAKTAGTFTYVEVEPWLDAEAVIRRRFVREWAAKADDRAFRERLQAGLAKHPEWERTLYPERFEPKAPTPVASAPQTPASGGSMPANPSVPSATPAADPQSGASGH